jgi:hypothetical protein
MIPIDSLFQNLDNPSARRKALIAFKRGVLKAKAKVLIDNGFKYKTPVLDDILTLCDRRLRRLP